MPAALLNLLEPTADAVMSMTCTASLQRARDWRCRLTLRIQGGCQRRDCCDGHRHRESHPGDKCKPIWFRGQFFLPCQMQVALVQHGGEPG
jgi:hypothetical protein